jgi:predicted ATPase
MREALSRALDAEEAELGLRLAGALWRLWWMRGYYDEGRRWLEAALAKDSRASAARAKALEAVGWLADDQGDIDLAVAAAE